MQGFLKHIAEHNILVPENHTLNVLDINQETHTLTLVPLTPIVAEIDYKTVMLNIENLSGIFGAESSWPEPNMTYQQNLNSLRVHQSEFESLTAFAYSIINEDASRCFGSVYIDPSRDESFESEVYFWICKTLEVERAHIKNLLSDWLKHTWQFKHCKIY
ncbi:hypothetical protein [Pseudoalteromonas luteoviolacea]|uniref:Uncharacterized protein n=1 Tax=Pseudoalteromonas luteoviolacea S4060-1 TaxID=1365257 RepID=A0A167JWY7_9GAMM|nr:hypothetical protein [Pseudoalteromonas luteoviolacea]KZN61776.1 hypothetical protein N478_06825 [Pseudoalteromonas luteoviolacea S4060-1]